MALNQKHPPRPAMDLANMRQQGVRREINHLVASANFLAAYEAGGRAGVYGKPWSIAPGTTFRCGNGWPTSF